MAVTSNKVHSLHIHQIPHDLLVEVVLSYLDRSQRYVFLSTCKAWYPLLVKVRTIHISSEAHQLEMFVEDERYRSHVFGLVGIPWDEDKGLDVDVDDESSGNTVDMTRRKLSISLQLKYSSIKDDNKYLYPIKYCQYVRQMKVNYSETVGKYEVVNPTSQDFSTLGTKIVNLQFEELWKLQAVNWSDVLNNSGAAQALKCALASLSISLPESYSLACLRNVKQIAMIQRPTKGPICPLQLSYGCTLQTFHLKNSNIENISILAGIPEVIIRTCPNINNIAPLAASNKVTLNHCNAISDLALLSRVNEIILQSLDNLTDISMLGKVRKLTVTSCDRISKFPIPCGHNQEWKFERCNIHNMTGYEKLLLLEVSDSSVLTDISNLGKVRYLTVQYCPNVKAVPKPEGRLQEWQFNDVHISDVSIFQRMHKLILEDCSFATNELSGLSHINIVEIQYCASIETICNLSHINCLDIVTCETLRHIHNLRCVHEINVHECNGIDWHLPQIGAAANCKILMLNEIDSVVELNPLSDVIRNLQTLRLLHCYQLQDITTTNADGTRDYTALLNIDTLVIVQCNNFKVYDDDYINAHRHMQPLCKYPFNNNTLKEAVGLWYVLPQRAVRLYGHISTWDVRFVTNMQELFKDQHFFNEDISAWDVSNVRNMSFMFAAAKSFNQPLDTWSVSKVTTMASMFKGAAVFNQPLNSWNVGNVMNMQHMFHNAITFNQPLSGWNVSNVKNRERMLKMQYRSISL